MLCFSFPHIVMFTVAILNKATVKPPNISRQSLMKMVLNFMRNPKQAHILVNKKYISLYFKIISDHMCSLLHKIPGDHSLQFSASYNDN